MIGATPALRKGLILLLTACISCAPRARAGSVTPASATSPAPPSTEPGPGPAERTETGEARRGDTPSEPLTQQRIARALDPPPGSDRCGGYTFDGVSLGLTREAVEQSLPLVPVPDSEGMIAGFEGRTFAFRAARPGRVDDVQVGFFDSTPPTVAYIHAQVLVAPDDSWPRTLFDRLGNPKNARMGEWIWWDMTCEMTLRLTKVDALDGGTAQSYTLEVRRTLKPAGEAP